jgi:lipopolysaccharide heptosyltransferase I
MKPAAFLDRDGTLMPDLGYLGDPSKVVLLPGAAEAVRRLRRAGFAVVVVSNQAGVARGLLTEADVRAVNARLDDLLAEAGAPADAYYYCPHHPDLGAPPYRQECACRKPKPGLGERAARDLGLDPRASVVIGDHRSDVGFGRALGARGVLVLTGHGREEAARLGREPGPIPDYLANDLRQAVTWVLRAGGDEESAAADPPRPGAALVGRPVDLGGVERVLVVKPSSIGDVVHALPVLMALRIGRPAWRITWLVEEEAADLLRDHPLLDGLIVSGRRRWGRRRPGEARGAPLAEAMALGRALRGGAFDLVLDLQGLAKSAVPAWLSGAAVRVGFADARELAWAACTHWVDCPAGARHAVERYLAMAEAVGAARVAAQFPLPASEVAEARAAGWLGSEGARPVVALSATARWDTKRWEPDRFARVADALAAEVGAAIVLLGGPGDRDATAAIARRMSQAPLCLAGETSLADLVAILKRVSLLITVDSGPMHLAAALGRPLVALFGPTDPRRTGPYGAAQAVVRRSLPCSPCLKRRCQIREERLCLRLIGEDDVADAARRLLAEAR